MWDGFSTRRSWAKAALKAYRLGKRIVLELSIV
jgi:hypothetical protein